MKTTIKIISMLMIVMMITTAVTPIFAVNAGDVISSLDNKANSTETPEGLMTIAAKILGFIRNLSYILGVIVLVILGVKYMMGSLEEKAEYKKSLLPFVVGIIIVMSATTLAKFLFDAFKA